MSTNTPLAPLNWRPIAALFGVVLLLAIVGALSSLRPAAQAEQAAIIMIATPSPAPAVPTAAPRALLGYFDYRDPTTATAFMVNDLERVIGQAGAFRLVELAGGGRVWVALADIPAGVPVADPLTDLAPRPTPIVVYVPAELPAAPTIEHRVGEKPSTKEAPTKVAPQQVR